MFYKKDYLPDTTKQQFEHSPEFIIALYEKMKTIPGVELGIGYGYDKDDNILFKHPVLLMDNAAITIKGAYSKNPFIPAYQRQYPGIEKIEYCKTSTSDFDNSYPNFDTEKLNQAKELISDFFNVKASGKIVDKYNKEYSFYIVQNADPSIGDRLVVDQVYLYDGDKQIGYLKAKYTTKDISQKLGMVEKKDIFMNTATIDFSRIEEDYWGRGLGYCMYFEMSKHLTSQKIGFRASSIQTESAQGLWNGITNHFSEYIKNKKVSDKILPFLKIGQDCIMAFIDEKPVITSKKKKTP